MDEKENIYEVFPIVENIEIENIQKMADELDNGDGVIIIYTNTDNLEMEFEKIISIYNIIPYIKNKKSKITYIKPYKKKDLYMVIDPNYSEDQKCNYIKVRELC